MPIPAFTKEYKHLGKIYRAVPGYRRLIVSEDGEFYRLGEDGNPAKRCPQFKMHNTRTERRSDTTYYWTVREIADNGGVKTTGAHILVCRAWNGMPPDDGIKYDVNHKNSIKTDNRAENLEWSTRSQNIAHCFDSGENCAAVRIIQRNIETGEEKIFRSIKNFAETMGLFRVNVRSFIAAHSKEPHNGFIYSIEEPRNFRIKPVRYQTKEVAYFDYTSRKLTICSSIEHASLETGIKSATIKHACNRFANDGVAEPTRQFFFQFFKPGMEWPEFTAEELEKFEKRFLNFSRAASGPRKHSSESFPSTEM